MNKNFYRLRCDYNQNIALLIKKRRNELLIKQEYLAKKIGMSQCNYSKLENGCGNFNIIDLIEICKILELSFISVIINSGIEI